MRMPGIKLKTQAVRRLPTILYTTALACIIKVCSVKSTDSLKVSKSFFIMLAILSTLGVISTCLYLSGSIDFKHKFTNEDYKCETRISKAVDNKFVIIENGGCEQYIDYKNLPEDTEIYSLNGDNDGEVSEQGIQELKYGVTAE